RRVPRSGALPSRLRRSDGVAQHKPPGAARPLEPAPLLCTAPCPVPTAPAGVLLERHDRDRLAPVGRHPGAFVRTLALHYLRRPGPVRADRPPRGGRSQLPPPRRPPSEGRHRCLLRPTTTSVPASTPSNGA